MAKNWHFVFLVLAFLLALFPPMYTAAPGLHMTTRFTFVFSQTSLMGPNANWSVLLALEATFLTAFAVIAADKRRL
jgi:hypothetical protein